MSKYVSANLNKQVDRDGQVSNSDSVHGATVVWSHAET